MRKKVSFCIIMILIISMVSACSGKEKTDKQTESKKSEVLSDKDNEGGEVVEAKTEQFNKDILKTGSTFKWESFNKSGKHHNGGTFTITKNSNDFLQVEQTNEVNSTVVKFVGAFITDEISEEGINFVLINPDYNEVWKCTYVDEHTMKGTVLDGTFQITY